MTDEPDIQTDTPGDPLERLRDLVGEVERRVRVRTGFDRATTAGTVALMSSTVALVLWKTQWLAFGDFAAATALLAALPAGAFVSAWFDERDPVELAQLLDRSHELHDRLSTALALVRDDRTDEFSAAQMRDALAHTEDVEPERAAPLRRPRDLPLFGLFLAVFGVLALFRPPSHAEPLPEPPRIKHDPILDSTTLAMEKEQVEEMKENLEGTDDPETEELVEEIESLLENVEDREISGREFLDRLDDIEKRHFDDGDGAESTDEGGAGDESENLSEALRRAAEQLENEASESLEEEKQLEETVEALKNEDLESASESLEKLGEDLSGEKEIDPERLKRMADLLEDFADNLEMDDEKLREMLEQNEELVDKLSKKLNRGDRDLSSREKRRLDRAKKKAEQLQKKLDGEERSEQERRLEQLRRKTKDASEKMRKASRRREGSGGDRGGEKQKSARGKRQGGKRKGNKKSGRSERGGASERDRSDYRRRAGRDLQRSSEELEEESDRQKSEEVRQAARKQLEELRRSMERSRPGRGEQSGKKGSSRSGETGGDRGEKMREYIRRAQGRSNSEKSGREGEQTGSGSEQKARSGDSNREGNSDGSGGQRADSSKGSNAAGDQPGGEPLGEEREIADTKRDEKHASGRKGAGPSRSQVIKSASEKGFATREYRDVYGEYSSVAEEVMDREDVPDGYRYYVKKYFELIKPRD